MAKPQTPTGRPRRVRIGLVCHTGIRPFREFLTFFSGLRRSLRQEYLRRCLVTGLRFGHFFESEWPEKDSEGNLRKVRVEITDGDPDLTPFLRQYDSRDEWEGRTLWVLKILLAGYGILSGSIEGTIVPVGESQAAFETKTDNRTESSEKLLGGLFS